MRYDIVIIIIFSTAIIQRYVYEHIVVIIFRFFPFRNPAVIISPYHHVGRRRFDRSNRPRATVVGSDRTTKRYININNDYNVLPIRRMCWIKKFAIWVSTQSIHSTYYHIYSLQFLDWLDFNSNNVGILYCYNATIPSENPSKLHP